MARATKYRGGVHGPGRTWILVGGTLVAFAAPAAVVGALWLAADSPLARVFAVLAADPTSLGVHESLFYWGVAVAAIGGWLAGVGLVLDGLAE